MKRTVLALLACLIPAAAAAQGGIPQFPQTLCGNCVVGRVGSTPGPTQAITFANLAQLLALPSGGVTFSQVRLNGAVSGVVTLLPAPTFSNYNFNYPTGPGTAGQPLLSGGGGTASQTYGPINLGGGSGIVTGVLPNTNLANSSVTYGTTTVALGASSTTIAGLTSVGLTSGSTINWNSDTFLGRRGAASFMLGAADAASPVAQTMSVQSVATGTSNTAGVDWTINASRGTGTGTGGNIVFQAAPAGGSGSAQNALTPIASITPSGLRIGSGVIYPLSDSTTALKIAKANATTNVMTFDTTNARVGINKTPGAFDLDVNGAANVGGALTFATTTITGLTANNSPNTSTDFLLYYNASDNAVRKVTVGSISSAATAGVSSLNGLVGGLSIVQGSNITVSAGGSSVTVNNASPHTGAKNVLVNGELGIWQRGSTNVTSGVGQYFPDQWTVTRFSVANSTFSRQTAAAGTGVPFELRMQRDNANANTTPIGVAQIKETIDSLPFAGKTAAFSFCATAGANFSPTSSILTSRIAYGTGTDQSMALFLSGAWTGFTTSDQSNTISTTRTCFTHTFAIPTSATQIGVYLQMVPVGTAGAADYAQIGALKLEVGTVATTFQAEDVTVAIARAERFYQKSYDIAIAPASVTTGGAIRGFIGGSSQTWVLATLRTRMRTPPTVTFYSPATGASANVRNLTSGADAASGAANNVGEAAFNCSCAIGAAGDVIQFHWAASSEL